MGQNLFVELFTQNDSVLKMLPGNLACVSAVVPDCCLAQESETRHMNDSRPSKLIVGCEENRGTENSFKGVNQTSIFFTALVHSERVEHFRAALEANRLA